MKAYLGVLGVAVALSGGIAAGLYALSPSSPPVVAKPPEAATAQELAKAIEVKRKQPETTGAAPREPRIIPITRTADKNLTELPGAPKQLQVSAAKTKKEEARERAEHRKAERKARREARRNHNDRRARAYQELGYRAYGPGHDEFGAFSYR